MKTLLWLDDYRNPMESQWLVFNPIREADFEVHWVKNYDQFVEWILANGLPTGICFDHDLDPYQGLTGLENVEEKTGYDCAKWLMKYCYEKKLPIPLYNIQSANPVGKQNIDQALKHFQEKYQFNPKP